MSVPMISYCGCHGGGGGGGGSGGRAGVHFLRSRSDAAARACHVSGGVVGEARRRRGSRQGGRRAAGSAAAGSPRKRRLRGENVGPFRRLPRGAAGRGPAAARHKLPGGTQK